MALGQPSKHRLKRLVARALIVALVFSMLPQQAFASYTRTDVPTAVGKLPSLPAAGEALAVSTAVTEARRPPVVTVCLVVEVVILGVSGVSDPPNRTHDDMGRLAKTTYPDTTTEESTYDGEGRRLSSKDRGGRATSYEYDAQGRLLKTTYPDTNFTTDTYDDAGRLETTTDANGNTTTYVYDAAGRRTQVIDALLQETVFGYDPNGNQTSVTDPRGKTTTYEYDVLNRRTKTIFHDGTFTQTGYDALGRRVSETDQASKITEFAYDALGRLTKVTNYVDGVPLETTYTYDEVGNRIRQTDAEGRTTSFEYDELGRQTKRTLPQVGTDPAAFEVMTYFPDGNLETRTDFMGRTTTYAYDADTGRLSSRSYPDSSSLSFTYTPTGRRETVTDSRGVTSYAYDDRDRMETLTHPDGRQLGYGYDNQGNRTSLTATVGTISHAVSYTYDELNRLDVVTDWNGGTYDHGYDPHGNRASLAYPNSISTSYTYDDLNRLTNLTTSGPLGHIQSYDFTLGPAGNREHIVEHAGLPQQRTLDYTYDDLYRLTGETVTESLGQVYSKTFSYDAVGNRQEQVTTGQGAGTVAYTYDERDRIELEGTQGYSWDENGNLVSKDAEATYFWDYENRLTRVEKADGTVVEHAYDADGNRVQAKTTLLGQPTETINFLVDSCCSLSHVVAETDESGTLIATYVRGDDLLAVIRPSETRYFHADGIGSIRRLTNEASAITDGYTHTTFGELIAHTGTDPQPYAFTGEPYDPNVALAYHRARWMDPSVGRFTSVDPFGGSSFEPLSLHRYLYANQDPLNVADPSGLFGDFSIGSLAAAGAMIGALAANAIVQPRTVTETVQVTLLGAAIGAGAVLLAEAGAVVAVHGVRATLLRLFLLMQGGTIAIQSGPLGHAARRHLWGGSESSGASVFLSHIGIFRLINLIRVAEGVAGRSQANGNLQRIVYAGQAIGIDRYHGMTSFYTVITTQSGRLVTVFPGLPARVY